MKSKETIQDCIYLLSIEEYEKYKDKIPPYLKWWWLRSAGKYQEAPTVASVIFDLSVFDWGDDVDDIEGSVRPALNTSRLDTSNIKYINDNTVVFCGATWLKIDTNLYISEFSLGTRRFDEKSSDYLTSEIRQFLLDWYEERKNW